MHDCPAVQIQAKIVLQQQNAWLSSCTDSGKNSTSTKVHDCPTTGTDSGKNSTSTKCMFVQLYRFKQNSTSTKVHDCPTKDSGKHSTSTKVHGCPAVQIQAKIVLQQYSMIIQLYKFRLKISTSVKSSWLSSCTDSGKNSTSTNLKVQYCPAEQIKAKIELLQKCMVVQLYRYRFK